MTTYSSGSTTISITETVEDVYVTYFKRINPNWYFDKFHLFKLLAEDQSTFIIAP